MGKEKEYTVSLSYPFMTVWLLLYGPLFYFRSLSGCLSHHLTISAVLLSGDDQVRHPKLGKEESGTP